MDNLNGLLMRLTRATSLFVAACLLAWAFAPSGQPIYAGLALGALASWINALYLSLRVKRIAAYALGEGRRSGIGFWARAAVALAAVILSQRVPGIHLYGVIAGLFFAQLATLLLGIASRKNQS